MLTALRSNPGGACQLARLAHHADEAHDAAAVLEFAPAAAAEATALGAHQEAAAQYTRAMRYADDLPPERRAMLLEGRALSSYLANQVIEASACLQEAVLLRHGQGDRLREGDDLRWLSHMLWPAGRAEASHVATAAVRVLQEVGQTRELAWAYVNMAQIASLDYDVAAAADYAQRAIELGSRFDEPAIAIRARAYAALAEALSRDQGWLELEQTWELAVKAGLPEHAGVIGFLACWAAATHRDLDRADRLLAGVVPYCVDQDLMLFLSYSRGASALAMLHRGQWSKAAATATTVLADPGPLPINRLAPLVVLGLTRARRGKAGAWPLPPESISMDHPADRYPFGLAWEAWAEATWLAGDDTRAVAVAESGLAKVTSAADPWLAGALACWCQRAGGTPRKVQAAQPYALELAGEWATAAARWERRGCTYEAAMARLAGDVPAVRHALDVFEALGAEPAAARARARLKSLGVSRGTRGPNSATRTCLFGLTKRQMEVLHLLKDDLSDGQIAAQLHIATKTASCHVSAVLTKLGVQTRHQAVRKLAQTPRGNDDQDGSITTSG